MTAVGAPLRLPLSTEVLVDESDARLCHPSCGFHTERRTCTLHLPGEPLVHKLKARERTEVCLRAAGLSPPSVVSPARLAELHHRHPFQEAPGAVFTTTPNAAPATRRGTERT